MNCDCYHKCPDVKELYREGEYGKRFEDLADQHEALCTMSKEPVCGLRDELRKSKAGDK